MIIGVGTDIIEIRRIRDAVEKNERFLTRFFTETEIEYFRSRNLRPETTAGRFAAKEAVVKALGTGFRGFGLKDVEIVNNDLGKPEVWLHGKAKFTAEAAITNLSTCREENYNFRIHISISHSQENAAAFAVFEAIPLTIGSEIV